MSQQLSIKQSVYQKLELINHYMDDARMFPALTLSILLVFLLLVLSSPTTEKAPADADRLPAWQTGHATTPVAAVSVSDDLLHPQMRIALNYASRKYRVSAEALEPSFLAAQMAARESGLDPLLIVAVISIESRFNPYAESAAGAQGLMQVVPRWHQDKIPSAFGTKALFDPETNIRVGTQILRESIRSEGGLIAGLQQFAGAGDDPELDYANKVLAQKRELDAAVGRISVTRL
jgi:hypothetical protein